MKILLATDGSAFSQAAVSEIIQRSYAPGTEVKIISVVHPWPFIPEPTFMLVAAHYESLEEGRKRAEHIIANAAKKISESASQLIVTTEIFEGSPKQVVHRERGKNDVSVYRAHTCPCAWFAFQSQPRIQPHGMKCQFH